MAKSKTDRVLELVKQSGILRPRDLDAHNIPRQYLYLLYSKGRIQRVGRGLYIAAGTDLTEHHSLAEVCKRLPHGVICLLSALRFHGLTTQLPFEVWMAIDEKARAPRVYTLRLRIMRFSGKALSEGVEEHKIEGVTVKVYNPAKTVADCFKYRNKIGLEVALETLQDCWRQRRVTMDEFWKYAKICRVANVMRPYLESLV